MLIFVKGDYEAQIVSGHKTMTIRPWERCKLQPGDPLSFNGRVRTTITRVEQRRVRDLTDADAHADGFVNCVELRRALRQHYPALTLTARVWCLSFRLTPPTTELRHLLHEAYAIIDTADGKAIPVTVITAWKKAARVALRRKV